MSAVRPATLADAEQMGRVHVNAWRGAYRGLLPDELLDGLSADQRITMWTRILTRHRPNSGAFVAESKGKIVGFSSWSRHRQENRYLFSGELETIYLLPESYGQGLGYQLFLSARDAAVEHGCRRWGLWVLNNNGRAINFYEKVGFTRDPERNQTETISGHRVHEWRYTMPLTD